MAIGYAGLSAVDGRRQAPKLAADQNWGEPRILGHVPAADESGPYENNKASSTGLSDVGGSTRQPGPPAGRGPLTDREVQMRDLDRVQSAAENFRKAHDANMQSGVANAKADAEMAAQRAVQYAAEKELEMAKLANGDNMDITEVVGADGLRSLDASQSTDNTVVNMGAKGKVKALENALREKDAAGAKIRLDSMSNLFEAYKISPDIGDIILNEHSRWLTGNSETDLRGRLQGDKLNLIDPVSGDVVKSIDGAAINRYRQIQNERALAEKGKTPGDGKDGLSALKDANAIKKTWSDFFEESASKQYGSMNPMGRYDFGGDSAKHKARLVSLAESMAGGDGYRGTMGATYDRARRLYDTMMERADQAGDAYLEQHGSPSGMSDEDYRTYIKNQFLDQAMEQFGGMASPGLGSVAPGGPADGLTAGPTAQSGGAPGQRPPAAPTRGGGQAAADKYALENRSDPAVRQQYDQKFGAGSFDALMKRSEQQPATKREPSPAGAASPGQSSRQSGPASTQHLGKLENALGDDIVRELASLYPKYTLEYAQAIRNRAAQVLTRQELAAMNNGPNPADGLAMQ